MAYLLFILLIKHISHLAILVRCTQCAVFFFCFILFNHSIFNLCIVFVESAKRFELILCLKTKSKKKSIPFRDNHCMLCIRCFEEKKDWYLRKHEKTIEDSRLALFQLEYTKVESIFESINQTNRLNIKWYFANSFVIQYFIFIYLFIIYYSFFLSISLHFPFSLRSCFIFILMPKQQFCTNVQKTYFSKSISFTIIQFIWFLPFVYQFFFSCFHHTMLLIHIPKFV